MNACRLSRQNITCVFDELKTISDLNNYLGYASVIIDVTSGFNSLKTPIIGV